MNVYQFTTNDNECTEWVAAKDQKDAIEFTNNKTDFFDEYLDGTEMSFTIKVLNQSELDTLKFDPDPEGTGEFKASRGIPFSQAIKGRESEMPFLLCSQMD